MRFHSRALAVLAVAAMAAQASCGFDEKLTSRGFVEAGDGLCGEALGRTLVAVEDTPGAGSSLDPEAIGVIARTYAGVADGLRRLDVREEDEAMRDEMVRRYAETAAQIRTIAAGAAGDPSAPLDTVIAIEELRSFASELREYGFKICGGRERA